MCLFYRHSNCQYHMATHIYITNKHNNKVDNFYLFLLLFNLTVRKLDLRERACREVSKLELGWHKFCFLGT